MEIAEYSIIKNISHHPREVTVEALVGENTIWRHDFIFGRQFCKEMKLQLNFNTDTIVWDDLSIPMKRTQSNKNTVNAIDPTNASLPTFMQKAAAKIVTEIEANGYGKHDYKAMMNKCDHLTDDQKGKLLHYLANTKTFFPANSEKYQDLL